MFIIIFEIELKGSTWNKIKLNMVWDKYKRDALHLIVWDPLEIISWFFFGLILGPFLKMVENKNLLFF